MVHRHDDPVGGQSVRDADHGGDVQDDTHTLGQGAQRCFCGLPVRWVIHEVTVDVERIMRGHGSRKVRPRVRGCHRLGSLCGDEGTFGSAIDQSNAEAVVHPLHSGTGVDDSFAREGLLDQRGVGALADWTEGDGLGPHAACRHERVQTATHMGSLVGHPLGVGSVELRRHREYTVHEDLPHEDDAARRVLAVGGSMIAGDMRFCGVVVPRFL